MAELFEKNKEKTPIEDSYFGLYEVYILYFDEEKGHIPLLTYPSDSVKKSDGEMRPVYIHSIWFLDIEEISPQNHIDLEYNDKMYFATKFHVASQRERRRAGIKKGSPEKIVLMLALPTNLIIFGDDLIQKLTQAIKKNYQEEMLELIEAEIGRNDPIKSQEVKLQIKKANQLKENIKEDIKTLCEEYFSTVIDTGETKSLKKQLEEIGIDLTHKIMAWLGVTVDPNHLKKVAQKLASYDNVIVAAISSGDHDLIVQLIADNIRSLRDFVDKIVKPMEGINPDMDVSVSYITGSKYLK
ncbi:MAG: Lrp/AsnC family transcriptional regulator [Promethearchaeota archaeon]|nr:MAG: Lrp/AsnC family transcriptional regulator [Candidatus Lokiarchaeota archaeon]